MTDKPKCQLCGEPMPEGEEMFNYHGYSGNCPKPPLKKEATHKTETAWLIEIPNPHASLYLAIECGKFKWSYGWQSAIRFCRKEDAEACLTGLLDLDLPNMPKRGEAKAIDHMWC